MEEVFLTKKKRPRFYLKKSVEEPTCQNILRCSKNKQLCSFKIMSKNFFLSAFSDRHYLTNFRNSYHRSLCHADACGRHPDIHRRDSLVRSVRYAADLTLQLPLQRRGSGPVLQFRALLLPHRLLNKMLNTVIPIIC